MMGNQTPSSKSATNGRMVIVGASLAGLRAVSPPRAEGFTGHLTLIGDEPHEPYNRPPLSKAVQTGWISVMVIFAIAWVSNIRRPGQERLFSISSKAWSTGSI